MERRRGFMRRLEALEDVNLKPELILAIQELGKRYGMDQIVLFGSRARKTNWERSDIDLRISTFDSEAHLDFVDALEELDTLLMFDVVNRRSFHYSAALNEEIERDGVILYEKV
jgi:Predicted nucleotidyltransferases